MTPRASSADTGTLGPGGEHDDGDRVTHAVAGALAPRGCPLASRLPVLCKCLFQASLPSRGL